MATFYGNIQKTSVTPINPDILAWYEFENNFNDSTVNGYNLDQNGTVPFATSPVPPFGTYSAGVFSDANYYSGPASLNTALSNPTNGIFFEAYVYANSIANSPVIEFKTALGSDVWMQLISGGIIKQHWLAYASIPSAGGVFNANEWTYVAHWLNTGNGNSKVWCSPANAISQTPVALGNYNLSATTVTNTTISRFLSAGSYALNGYIADAKYSLTEPSTLPLSLV